MSSATNPELCHPNRLWWDCDSNMSSATNPELCHPNRLWWDCDSNMSGDVSVTEWQQYSKEKFSAIANKRANVKAYMESASESGCDAWLPFEELYFPHILLLG
jgi:hypothetical protein